MISLIWAMDRNRLIGRENSLPWRLPADLANFKGITQGHAVVMGRKTFESIGKPLPGRKNIVISRNKNLKIEGCDVIRSIEDIRSYSENDEVFVIGGAEIYKEFLPIADKLYITEIEESFEGDAYFPELDLRHWTLASKVQGVRDEKNPYGYSFKIYERKK